MEIAYRKQKEEEDRREAEEKALAKKKKKKWELPSLDYSNSLLSKDKLLYEKICAVST